ncbi:tetratricopeptide repeat protein [Streptomyces aculeolatus]|uniref:tetratricopeptide repeat protein n=1 Tax=Streptomyces aculeolatus TaxID=270689 RepID=UPI001CED2693|nr:tetratricopeptide repeat protein [Streptomyces aculeolatus]
MAALALLASTPAVLTALKVTDPWAVTLAAGGAAVLVSVVVVWQERYKRVAQQRDEHALLLRDGCLVLSTGRLPKVTQAKDPLQLGVHPAFTGGLVPGRIPAYVGRDIDAELRERLAAGGFVLLIGDSTAGKSRAAYEAMRAVLPHHVLIAPRDRAALPAALARAAEMKRCVLWLSDLEKYLGAEGLTRTGVARVVAGEGHHRVILATLRAAEQARLVDAGTEPDEAGRTAFNEARETLEQAESLRLDRIFSAAERDRARAHDRDPRIADALAHADDYGIAECMAAGPDLLRDWQDAWSPNTDPAAPTHPRAAALIAAAIDIRRAGYTSPVSRRILRAVHEHYLNTRGGARLRPEPLTDAWEWATRSRRATTALLQPEEDDCVRVFDYLADAVQRRSAPDDHVPEHVVRTVMTDCDAQDAHAIAMTAHAQGRYGLAEAGWRTVLQILESAGGENDSMILPSRSNLALTLRRLGRLDEAEEEGRVVRDVTTRVMGEEHPDTLACRGHYAASLAALGRLEEAEREFRAVLEIQTRVLGAEHPGSLNSRGNFTTVLAGLGRLEEAEAELRVLLEIANRVLGPDHLGTLALRDTLATVLTDQGHWEAAETEIRAVLEIRSRTMGTAHPGTLTSRNNLAIVLRHQGRLAEAADQHRAELGICTRVMGGEHPETLTSRYNLASVLAGLRRWAEAEAELRAVLGIQTRVLGPDHPDTLASRKDLAIVRARPDS